MPDTVGLGRTGIECHRLHMQGIRIWFCATLGITLSLRLADLHSDDLSCRHIGILILEGQEIRFRRP